jgi:uncharacterized LabA/DUF88 family protein
VWNRVSAAIHSPAENDEENNFFEALTQQGFQVIIKDLQVFTGGAKKGDWDVGIAVDAIKLAEKLDGPVALLEVFDYLDFGYPYLSLFSRISV